jgi:hypothetical protein
MWNQFPCDALTYPRREGEYPAAFASAAEAKQRTGIVLS